MLEVGEQGGLSRLGGSLPDVACGERWCWAPLVAGVAGTGAPRGGSPTPDKSKRRHKECEFGSELGKPTQARDRQPKAGSTGPGSACTDI